MAARRGLDQQRIADGAGAFDEGCGVVILDGRGRNRKAAPLDKGAGADLVAHQVDDLGCGTDKRHAGLVQRGDEACVFRQKAIARMHRVRADAFCRLDDPRVLSDLLISSSILNSHNTVHCNKSNNC